MKAVQLFHKTLFRSLQSNRSFSFAKLAKETEVDDDVIKYTNAKEYYDYLLRFTPSDERGYVKFREGQFSKMVNIANSTEDISSIRDAFYNFIGHKLKLSNTQVDNYLQKAIELKSGSTVHEIIANHNFLKYFPHPDVLRALAQQHVQDNNTDAILELSTIYANGYFLKVDAATLETIARFAATSNNDSILYQVARAAAKKNILQISEETISYVLGGLARRRLAGTNEPKEGEEKKGDPNKVELKFLELISKIPQTYKTILAKAYLTLSKKDIDGALVTLANFHQVDAKKLENGVEVINNTPLTLEFFDKLSEAITASNKPKYAERLGKVAGDIAIKLGKNAINQEVQAKIDKIVADSKQAPKEEQPKAEEQQSEQPTQAAQ